MLSGIAKIWAQASTVIIFVILRFEHRALDTLGNCSTTEWTSGLRPVVSVFVCGWRFVCTYTCTWVLRPEINVSCLSLLLPTSFGGGGGAGSPIVPVPCWFNKTSSPQSPVFPCLCLSSYPDVTWVLGVWTWVLMFVREAVCWLSHLPKSPEIQHFSVYPTGICHPSGQRQYS